MFEDVRGPITESVLTYARGKMLRSFADIAGTTARTQKLVYHTRTEPTRDRILHTEHVADAMAVIPRLPSLTLYVPFTLNYLILVLFLLSRRKKVRLFAKRIILILS